MAPYRLTVTAQHDLRVLVQDVACVAALASTPETPTPEGIPPLLRMVDPEEEQLLSPIPKKAGLALVDDKPSLPAIL